MSRTLTAPFVSRLLALFALICLFAAPLAAQFTVREAEGWHAIEVEGLREQLAESGMVMVDLSEETATGVRVIASWQKSEDDPNSIMRTIFVQTFRMGMEAKGWKCTSPVSGQFGELPTHELVATQDETSMRVRLVYGRDYILVFQFVIRGAESTAETVDAYLARVQLDEGFAAPSGDPLEGQSLAFKIKYFFGIALVVLIPLALVGGVLFLLIFLIVRKKKK